MSLQICMKKTFVGQTSAKVWLAKSRGNGAFISVANCSFLCPRDPTHVYLLSLSRSEYNLVVD